MRIVGAVGRRVDRLASRFQPRSPNGPARTSPLGRPAAPIRGVDPAGDHVEIEGAVGSRLLIAFLTGSCRGCQVFWNALAARSDPGFVVVTPDPATESRRQIAGLAPSGVTVVMSSRAWFDYGVARAPWFALAVDGVITAEGHAATWADLQELAGS